MYSLICKRLPTSNFIYCRKHFSTQVELLRQSRLQQVYTPRFKGVSPEEKLKLILSGNVWMEHSGIFDNYNNEITPQLLDQLNTIDNKKKRILLMESLSKTQQEVIDHDFKISFTHHSTAIEGNTLSKADTGALLDKYGEGLSEALLDGITKEELSAVLGKEVSKSECMEVIRHGNAWELARSLSNKSLFNLSEEDIIALHKSVYGETTNSRYISVPNLPITSYRTTNIHVIGSATLRPYPWEVPAIMQHFIKWIKYHAQAKKLHPLIFACQIHSHFLHIHPFHDGNGRTARLLWLVALRNLGYYAAVIPVTDRPKYINSLEKAQNRDPIEYYLLMLSRVDTFLDKLLSLRIEKVL